MLIVARTFSCFGVCGIACCRISVASLSFLRTRLSSERKHLSTPDFTARAWKNYACVLGLTISGSDRFLMAESYI